MIYPGTFILIKETFCLESYCVVVSSERDFILKIGPIPTDDGVGKEVITRLTANLATEKVFYTDSNGRDFLKRVKFSEQTFI